MFPPSLRCSMHRGRNEDSSPPDFDGGRLGNYSRQRSEAFIIRVGRADRARSPLKIPRNETSPSAPPFSGEHGGPMPIARVRKPVSARVRTARYPAWPILIEPGSGGLCASESTKLLLRAFRPSHNDEIAVSLRRKNFEGGRVLHDRHSNFCPCFHGRSLPRCEEPGPKLEETLSCGAAGWPGGTANRRGAARELLRPRALRFARDS